MTGPDGSIVGYDGFAGYPATRLPANAPGGGVNANDTMFLVYRITLAATPDVVRGGFVYDRRTARFTQQVTVSNSGPRAIAGPLFLALDGPVQQRDAGRRQRRHGRATAGGQPVRHDRRGGERPGRGRQHHGHAAVHQPDGRDDRLCAARAGPRRQYRHAVSPAHCSPVRSRTWERPSHSAESRWSRSSSPVFGWTSTSSAPWFSASQPTTSLKSAGVNASW